VNPLENKIRIIFSIFYGILFPLFGIFIVSKFEFMGINLFNDILTQIPINFSYSMFKWLNSIFRGDIINQIQINGIKAFIQQPLMQSLLVWILHGYLIGIILKKYKLSLAITSISFGFLVMLYLIFILICDNSFGTIELIFYSNHFYFIGGILFYLISLLFSTIGVKISK